MRVNLSSKEKILLHILTKVWAPDEKLMLTIPMEILLNIILSKLYIKKVLVTQSYIFIVYLSLILLHENQLLFSKTIKY